MGNLSVSIGNLKLTNPVLVAAGTFAYGTEFSGAVKLDRLGAIITKTLTPDPREGNNPPRLVETPSGMLNAVGLQNMGIEPFLKEKLPALKLFSTPIIVSILGETSDAVSNMTRLLDSKDEVSAIELNLSCPNIQNGSTKLIAQDPLATEDMVKAACEATAKPIIAKLSPDVTDMVPIACAAERAGAAALSISNTFKAMSIDTETRKSRLGVMTGGLSGPAIRPLAVYRVWYTAQTVKVPIIGVGGILSAADAIEFILAGASAVGVGTASFSDPRAAIKVIDGLEKYFTRHDISSIDDLRLKIVSS